MKIRDIMIKEVKSISPEMNAKEALDFLEKLKISGLPVIDAQGKLAGMFTEKEVLSNLLPRYIQDVGSFVYEENPKSVRKKFLELNALKVSQLMRKEVETTTEDTALCEAAHKMLTQKARRMPVLDKEGRVVGIVARCDILQALTRENA